jgi:hypothetical protein
MGIGFLWILPYLQTAMARFYDDLLGNSLSAAEPGTRTGAPITPRPPQKPPEPAKASRPDAPAAAAAPAEAPRPTPHARARMCLSCHTPIPDPEAKSCPSCGFPLMEVPGSPQKPSPAPAPAKPADRSAPGAPASPPLAKQPPAPSSRPLDLEGTIMVGPPRLLSLSPEGEKEIYDLRLPVITIGRADDNTLAFPKEKTISGHHCEIYREGKDFFIRDRGSTNGVLVNASKVDSAPLAEGDEIKLGAKVFTFTRSA